MLSIYLCHGDQLYFADYDLWKVTCVSDPPKYKLQPEGLPEQTQSLISPHKLFQNSLVVMVVPHCGIAFLARHAVRSLLGCSNEQLAKLFNTQHSWMVSSLIVKVINV